MNIAIKYRLESFHLPSDNVDQPSLSIPGQQHDERHRDDEKYRNRRTHPPILRHEKMLLNRRAERNDAVAGNKARNHKQRQCGNEHRHAARLDAAERQRKHDAPERHPRRSAKIARGVDERRVHFLQGIEDGQNHKRDKNIDGHEHKAEVGKQDLLCADSGKLQHRIHEAVCAEQADERIRLQQQIDPARQNNKKQPQRLVLRPGKQICGRISNQQREQRNEESVPERADRHAHVHRRKKLRIVVQCKAALHIQERIVQDEKNRRRHEQHDPQHVRDQIQIAGPSFHGCLLRFPRTTPAACRTLPPSRQDA